VAAGSVLGTAAALALVVPGAGAAVPHTVQPGESLWSIAAANNFTTASVAAYNGLSPDALVVVGQTIQVPTEAEGAAALASAPSTTTSTTTSTAGSHTVTPGETLSGIAAANGVSTESLAAANGLDPTAFVIIGQTLSIPAGGSSTTSSSGTAGSHTVVAGETLSGIALANGVSTESLAAANGIDPTAYVIIGQTLSIPVVTSATSSSGISLAPIYCPCGTVYLRSDAASEWNQMRSASQSTYGQDIYPGGPASAYRTWDQQNQLYQDYLNGTGAPANPPGTSSHELGTAVDVAEPSMRSVIDSIGSTFGWGKIHGPGEWWHVDYLGGG
jgi:LysM repeat protein